MRVPQAWQNTVNAATPTSGTFAALGGSGYCTHASLSNTAQGVGIYRFAPRDKDIRSGNNWSGVNVGTGCGNTRMTPATWQGCVGDRDMVGNLEHDGPDHVRGPSDMSQRHPAVACFSNSLARMRP